MTGKKRQVAFSLADERTPRLKRSADAEGLSLSAYVRRLCILMLEGKLVTVEQMNAAVIKSRLEEKEGKRPGVY